MQRPVGWRRAASRDSSCALLGGLEILAPCAREVYAWPIRERLLHIRSGSRENFRRARRRRRGRRGPPAGRSRPRRAVSGGPSRQDDGRPPGRPGTAASRRAAGRLASSARSRGPARLGQFLLEAKLPAVGNGYAEPSRCLRKRPQKLKAALDRMMQSAKKAVGQPLQRAQGRGLSLDVPCLRFVQAFLFQ